MKMEARLKDLESNTAQLILKNHALKTAELVLSGASDLALYEPIPDGMKDALQIHGKQFLDGLRRGIRPSRT